MIRTTSIGILTAVAALALSATGIRAQEAKQLMITYNPYQGVDWARTQRCLAQHHDHVEVKEAKYRNYDQAGYQAVVVLHYSGVASKDFTWKERHWPLSAYLTNYDSDATFLASCTNLKLLVPGAEEVGYHHMTSPFLQTYIAKWEPDRYPKREEWHYESDQECIDLIVKYGGMALLAHPIGATDTYRTLRNFRGMEVYSAYFAYKDKYGNPEEKGMNGKMVSNWDVALDGNSTRIWGIAVNDHYRPGTEKAKVDPEIFDSGKILVLLPEYTLAAYRQALEAGALFAIRDNGKIKGRIPAIRSITAAGDAITLDTDGAVKWITNGGKPAGEGKTLRLKSLPAKSTYVRAEVSNENGTVYVQPFSLGASAGKP